MFGFLKIKNFILCSYDTTTYCACNTQ